MNYEAIAIPGLLGGVLLWLAQRFLGVLRPDPAPAPKPEPTPEPVPATQPQLPPFVLELLEMLRQLLRQQSFQAGIDPTPPGAPAGEVVTVPFTFRVVPELVQPGEKPAARTIGLRVVS